MFGDHLFPLCTHDEYTFEKARPRMAYIAQRGTWSPRSGQGSISGLWVQEDVEEALERERREGRTVPSPHSAWTMSSWTRPRCGRPSLRRTRHIGDFSEWKDHDA
jgi:hypothetical protein